MDLTVPMFLGYFPGNHILTTQPDKIDAPMYHHNIGEISDITTRNLQECGVFFTVNELDQSLDPVNPVTGKKRHRTKKMLKRIRACFADDDTIRDGPRTDWPLEPSLVVNSSPGKYHYYWLLDTSLQPTTDEWILVQKGINKRFGTDESASQVNRVLRVPGFYHHKKAPHFVTFHSNEKVYGWDIIRSAFPPLTASEQLEIRQSSGDWLQHLRAVLAADGEGAHQHYVAAALCLANAGNKQDLVEFSLIGALQGIFAEVGRPWEEWRPQRIRDAAASAYEKLLQEQDEKLIPILSPAVAEANKQNEYTYLPLPGGGLWHVVQWVKSIMRYPNETIAIAVSEHIISVFGGGHYALMGNTQTRKRIVLGPPGCGKNAIVAAMDQICVSLEQANAGGVPYVLGIREYIGSDSFTFANQHKQMEAHRVRSFIVNEAGASKSSQAGDKDTLHAYQLQALSTKAKQSLKPREFSIKTTKAENQLKQVYGGVWVWYHESVVPSYAKVLHEENAFETGDFSRSDPIFVDPTIHNINPSAADTEVPEEVRNMIITMVQDFQDSCIQAGDTPEVCEQWREVDYSEVETRLAEMETDIVNRRNKAYSSEDTILISALARRFEKLVTTLLVCSIADAARINPMPRPCVTHAHLDYAIARQDAIDNALTWHTQTGRLSQLPDQIVEWIVERIKKGGVKLGRWSSRQYPLRVRNTYIHQILARKTEFIKLKDTVYNGDKNRALLGILEEMVTRNILEATDDRSTFVVNQEIVTKSMVENREFFKGKTRS